MAITEIERLSRATDDELAQRDLAWAKASLGVTLTADHKRLVVVEPARRAYEACVDFPVGGDERRILASLTGRPACEIGDEFAVLVAAYDEWRQVEDAVHEFRFLFDPPMSSERAIEYVGERLDDAVDALVGA